jgi:hypothetical protein
MASAIEDVSSLPGEMVRDQEGRKIGPVKEIYAVGDDATPMWVTVETSTGIGRTRDVFIPIARLKQEGEEIRTPYSYDHIQESPNVETGDELSEEDDRELRSYYSVGIGDREIVQAAQSYASQVPDEDGPAHRVDASEAEGQVRELDDKSPGERAREADEAEREEGGDEETDKPRKTTAEDVLGENKDDGEEDDGEKDDDGEKEDDGEKDDGEEEDGRD